MTEFGDFARNNIVVLDELMVAYAAHRAEIIQSFWDDLCTNVRQKVPKSWNFLKGNIEIGWSCDRQLMETQRTVTIAFSYDPSLSKSAWPIMNSWTGIYVAIHRAENRNRMVAAAKQLSISTEPPDSGWIFWENWTSLANTNVEGLYERLTGSGRVEEQQQIIDELVSWTTKFEDILKESPDLIQ